MILSILDPKVWGDDADAFKPERMLGENFTNLPKNCLKVGWNPVLRHSQFFSVENIVLANQFTCELNPDTSFLTVETARSHQFFQMLIAKNFSRQFVIGPVRLRWICTQFHLACASSSSLGDSSTLLSPRYCRTLTPGTGWWRCHTHMAPQSYNRRGIVCFTDYRRC